MLNRYGASAAAARARDADRRMAGGEGAGLSVGEGGGGSGPPGVGVGPASQRWGRADGVVGDGDPEDFPVAGDHAGPVQPSLAPCAVGGVGAEGVDPEGRVGFDLVGEGGGAGVPALRWRPGGMAPQQ
jgi:hypothetical protein